MNREKSLIKNTIVLAIGTVVPKVVGFVVLPLLTAYLTKKEYGTYDLITTLCFLLLPIVTLQIQTAAFRFLIEMKNNHTERKKIISNIFAYIIPISLLTLIGIYLFLFNLSTSTRILISLYFYVEILYQTTGQIVRGLSQNKVYSSASIVCSFTNLIALIVFLWALRLGLNGVLIALILSVAFPTAIMMIKVRIFSEIDIRLVDKKYILQLLEYSWPMIPNTISMWIMNASDRLVITFFLGVEVNAVYAVAKKIPNILTVAQSTFIMAWQESASLASADKDADAYYSRMFDTVFRMMSAVMIAILILLPFLFNILIRGDYGEAYIHMPIILMAMFFYSICSYLGGIYVAKKRTLNVGITTTVSAVINLIVNLMLIQRIGLFAASSSTLVSYVVLAIYRMINVKKIITINYDYKTILSTTVVLVIVSFLSVVNNTKVYFCECIIGILFALLLNKNTIMSFLRIYKSRIRKS